VYEFDILIVERNSPFYREREREGVVWTALMWLRLETIVGLL
jgi:hypothetical protein